MKIQTQQAPAKSPQNVALDEIFKRCQQIHEEIAESLDQAFKKSGISSTQLRAFASNPRNFSERDWRGIEEQKKTNSKLLQELQKKIEKEEALPPQKKEQKNEEQGPIAPAPPQKSPTKKPKIMTKRQWIGM